MSSDNALLCHSPNVQVILNVQSQFQLLTSLYNHSFLFPQILSVLSTKDFGEIFGELCVCVCVCVCFFFPLCNLDYFCWIFWKKIPIFGLHELTINRLFIFYFFYNFNIFLWSRNFFTSWPKKKELQLL